MAGTAVIVGAGLGGVAAAVALARRGWQVTVCERAPVLEPVGAGISLWPNALRALDVLGIGDAVRSKAVLGGGSGIRRPDGSWIGRSDIADAVRERFGDPLVVLARFELADLLTAALPAGALLTETPVRQVDPGSAADPSRPATVLLEDGRSLTADVVVAADGIASSIRAALFPGHPGPAYAGYTTWRFIAPAPNDVAGSETWGPRGQRFAIVPMSDERVYCYATATSPVGVRHPNEVEHLRTRFGRWHEPIPALLAGLRPEQVLHHDVHDLVVPLPGFTVGRVAVLGDAAHAMTPELGQGGCQALEDAVTLAALVAGASDTDAGMSAALTRYTELRLPRTTRLVSRSRSTGRLTQASSPVGAAVRNLSGRIMGRLPAGLVARGLDPVVDWRPPSV